MQRNAPKFSHEYVTGEVFPQMCNQYSIEIKRTVNNKTMITVIDTDDVELIKELGESHKVIVQVKSVGK